MRVWLALVLAACHRGAAPPPAADPVIDAAEPDAEPPPREVTPQPVVRGHRTATIERQAIALRVRSEVEAPTSPNIVVPRERPPAWLPTTPEGPTRVARVEPDGTVLAQSRHTLFFLSAAHQIESALDFEPLRGDLVRHRELCCDHATIDRGTVIDSPQLVDGIVILTGSDMERDDMNALLAVDARTATELWRTPHGMVPENFVVVRGNAITSTRESGRWTLDVVALDTGRIAARVPTAHGPYRLETREDGSIRGSLDGWSLDVSVLAQ